MYKIATDMLPELEKRIRAIGKKLDKYNLMWEFNKLDTVIEKVNVYDIDQTNGARRHIGERLIEVTPYTFWMETLKLQGFTVVARIEHDVLNVDGSIRNMVHSVNDHTIHEDWWNLKSKCDHCNTNRQRKVTIMMQSDDGTYSQIGSTCVKDFIGIDANDIISLYANIKDIYLDEAYTVSYSGKLPTMRYVETDKFVACALKYIEANGYEKSVTGPKSFSDAIEGIYEECYLIKARELIEFFRTLDLDSLPEYNQVFYRDVVKAVTPQYTKCTGLVAYAPIAYNEIQKVIAELERKLAEPQSAWQGEIGQKVELAVMLEKSISYTNDWGYGYIHLFRDEDSNIYKWSTGTSIGDIEGYITLKGTIKDHIEYVGVKQTVLTRCKISKDELKG